MSTKSPSMIVRWHPIPDKPSQSRWPPPAERREQARDLDLLASPLLPAASGGLV